MADKKGFALRMHPELFKALEQWASEEFRSTNGQMEYILHEALKNAGRLPKSTSKSTSKSQ